MESLHVFFLAAFGYTYLVWGFAVFSPPGPLRGPALFLGGAGPFIGAFLASNDPSKLWSSLLTLPPLHNLMAAVFFPLAINLLAFSFIYKMLPSILKTCKPKEGEESIFPQVSGPVLYLILFAFAPMLVLEEMGWRQYLFPLLLKSFSPTVASCLVGLAWALWHLPLLLPSDTPVHGLASENRSVFPSRVLVYIATLMSVSLLITWVGGGRESIWVATCAHASWNSSFGLFKIEKPGRTFVFVFIFTSLFWLSFVAFK